MAQRIGARLRDLRVAAKLTQEEVGERSGFSGKYVGEIEKGVRDVPLSTLRAVVEAGLGARMESVFGGRASRAAEAMRISYARDVEMTAELLAQVPLAERRALLALVKELVKKKTKTKR